MSVSLSRFLALLFAFFPVLASSQTTLTVAAASDLTNVEPPLQATFEKTNPIRIRWVTGASGVLTHQIENGAPYDIFLSANAQFVDRLAEKRKIEPISVRAYAEGQVGILWRDGKPHKIQELGANWVRIVALPNPQLAPYGVAAQQALEHEGLWKAVQPKVVYGENVRQTLELFESGNADAVLTSNSLLQGKPAAVLPSDWHAPIVQKAGIVTGTTKAEAAEKFLHFLLSPDAQAILAKFGFGSPRTK